MCQRMLINTVNKHCCLYSNQILYSFVQKLAFILISNALFFRRQRNLENTKQRRKLIQSLTYGPSHLILYWFRDTLPLVVFGQFIQLSYIYEIYFLVLFFIYFLLDIFFIYISNVIPFPSPPTLNAPIQYNSSCFEEGALPPIHPLLPPCPGIPLHWGIEPSHTKGLSSHLCPTKPSSALYVAGAMGPSIYSLVGGLVPGSSRSTGQFMFFLLWGCKPLQLLGSFLQLLHSGACAQFHEWL